VWTRFDPATSPQEAYLAGGRGGDQAWISHVLGKGEPVFTPADGVLSYRRHFEKVRRPRLPHGARVINFHGVVDPWSRAAQGIGWVREYYGDARAWPSVARPPRAPEAAHR